jgi:NADPH:quinone reductase-like Zn-dependent oxidoreductase
MAMTLSALLGLMETGNGTAVRTKTDLVLLRDWLESGRISPVIDRNYKLDESEDALTYQGTFHARGKIVVTI